MDNYLFLTLDCTSCHCVSIEMALGKEITAHVSTDLQRISNAHFRFDGPGEVLGLCSFRLKTKTFSRIGVGFSKLWSKLSNIKSWLFSHRPNNPALYNA
ncbi:hypothetical protein PoB_005978300 [Plakobranchus ocellatus]|uniref:Uncharacterized protein n=1 Tax=Plakobranchus ocellatus TaxID=259542 RepID=A0AAV4CM56_9GAST|nr:hypothetical protein PoB_005978300 [Plakobranchus ocellatus]